MARYKIVPKSKPLPRREVIFRPQTVETQVKQALKDASGWPDLKVHQWQPIAMKVYDLSEKLKPSDKRYRFIHDLCKNEIVRRKKQAKKQELLLAQQLQIVSHEEVAVDAEMQDEQVPLFEE